MITQTMLDSKDQAIIDQRAASIETGGPRVGDYVEFADGVTRRISYIWPERTQDATSDDCGPGGAQTSDGGSYYLGDGYVSMSGALYSSVPLGALSLTSEKRPASVWIFHHDHHTAGNGIDTLIDMRVYRCSEPAPR